MCRVASPPNEAGRGEATDTRDSGIRPARCWPVLGRDGQDDRPRGETLSLLLLTPTNAKRGVLAASASIPFAESPPHIRMGAIRAKNKPRARRSDHLQATDKRLPCQTWMFGVAIARRLPASRIGAVPEGESPYPATERSEPRKARPGVAGGRR